MVPDEKGESRYSRQELIDGWSQDKIKEGRVLFVGMGALGSVVATVLAMQGVGHFLIVDPDTVEISNLNRQLLFTEKDIGKDKAEVAARFLNVINPEIQIKHIVGRIEKVPDQIIREYDIIVDSLDQFDPRRWINSVAVNLNIPLVSGGIYGYFGNIQVVLPRITACLECQPLIPAHRLQKACTPLGDVRRTQAYVDTEEENIPSVASVSFTIGGIMAQECTKLLLGKQDMVLTEYIFWDGLSQSFTNMPLQRREDCVVCSERFQLSGIPFSVNSSETLKDLKNRLAIQFGGEGITILKGTQVLAEENILLGTILGKGDILRVISEDLPGPIKLRVIVIEIE